MDQEGGGDEFYASSSAQQLLAPDLGNISFMDEVPVLDDDRGPLPPPSHAFLDGPFDANQFPVFSLASLSTKKREKKRTREEEEDDHDDEDYVFEEDSESEDGEIEQQDLSALDFDALDESSGSDQDVELLEKADAKGMRSNLIKRCMESTPENVEDRFQIFDSCYQSISQTLRNEIPLSNLPPILSKKVSTSPQYSQTRFMSQCIWNERNEIAFSYGVGISIFPFSTRNWNSKADLYSKAFSLSTVNVSTDSVVQILADYSSSSSMKTKEVLPNLYGEDTKSLHSQIASTRKFSDICWSPLGLAPFNSSVLFAIQSDCNIEIYACKASYVENPKLARVSQLKSNWFRLLNLSYVMQLAFERLKFNFSSLIVSSELQSYPSRYDFSDIARRALLLSPTSLCCSIIYGSGNARKMFVFIGNKTDLITVWEFSVPLIDSSSIRLCGVISVASNHTKSEDWITSLKHIQTSSKSFLAIGNSRGSALIYELKFSEEQKLESKECFVSSCIQFASPVFSISIETFTMQLWANDILYDHVLTLVTFCRGHEFVIICIEGDFEHFETIQISAAVPKPIKSFILFCNPATEDEVHLHNFFIQDAEPLQIMSAVISRRNENYVFQSNERNDSTIEYINHSIHNFCSSDLNQLSLKSICLAPCKSLMTILALKRESSQVFKTVLFTYPLYKSFTSMKTGFNHQLFRYPENLSYLNVTLSNFYDLMNFASNVNEILKTETFASGALDDSDSENENFIGTSSDRIISLLSCLKILYSSVLAGSFVPEDLYLSASSLFFRTTMLHQVFRILKLLKSDTYHPLLLSTVLLAADWVYNNINNPLLSSSMIQKANQVYAHHNLDNPFSNFAPLVKAARAARLLFNDNSIDDLQDILSYDISETMMQSREKCQICKVEVPFSSFTAEICSNGHENERCTLTMRLIPIEVPCRFFCNLCEAAFLPFEHISEHFLTPFEEISSHNISAHLSLENLEMLFGISDGICPLCHSVCNLE
jgi:hypothetical protein